jgi:alpha-D-ribose 1-methylphosphonate 5-triphosphate synthase subunit PhnI
MYVAVKGGEKAINAAHRELARKRRGDTRLTELTVKQIEQQLPYAVDRVMTEGSLYDPQLAALAIKQAAGDLIEAIFLLRAYRTTLARFYSSKPINTSEMQVERRISASFKDIPGGQVLGPTFDYTHRLLDFSLLEEESSTTASDSQPEVENTAEEINYPQVLDLIGEEDLIEQQPSSDLKPDFDLTQQPVTYPTNRATRLQALTRGDEGFLLALGYSTQRGYGRNHPFAGEVRIGTVTLTIEPEELGFAIDIGDIEVTECQMINQFQGSKTIKPRFTRGYGIAFGSNERKAMSMALVDRSLRSEELDEEVFSPAQDDEFVLSHADNVEAVGFVSHLKLPHYVDFQSELELIRRLRKNHEEQSADTDDQDDMESVA